MSQKSKVLGGALIVAGTTIGAGMLALPMTSLQIGFLGSLGLLFLMWGLMTYTALLTCRLNAYFGRGVTIPAMASVLMGRWGSRIASFAFLFLFYSLLAAYIAGGTSLLVAELGERGVVGSSQWVSLGLTLLLGGVVFACTQAVDYANRLLFFLQIVAFVILLGMILPLAKSEHLLEIHKISRYWGFAIPIFFTSFGFHGSIPALVNYVGVQNAKTLRRMIFLGSLIPLIIYILWQAAALGVVTNMEAEGRLAAFIATLNRVAQQPFLGVLSRLFSGLAISTSFLGVGMGLFLYFQEIFSRSKKQFRRPLVFAFTFFIPLLFALYYPEGFLIALGYASIALSILAVLLPVWMVALVWKKERVRLFRHRWPLVLSFFLGLAIIITELYF